MDICNALALQLRAEHMHVDTAYSAKEGYYKATVNRYNTIVLDLNLPDGDGLTICHQLRQERVETPVLILTVRDEVADKVRGLETGADDYLTKPYSPAEILARINALSRRGTKQTTCIYKAKDIELNTRARQVIYRQQIIPLTRREFDLLQFFMEHDGEVITREDIWEKVWGWDDYPLHNTVDVHVKRLRDKLADYRARMIRTVRGIGYRFDVEACPESE